MMRLTLTLRTRTALLLLPSLVAMAVLPSCSSSESPAEGASGMSGSAGLSAGGGGGAAGASGSSAGTSGTSATGGGASGSGGGGVGGSVSGGAGGVTNAAGAGGTEVAGEGGSAGTTSGGNAGMTSGGSANGGSTNGGSTNGGSTNGGSTNGGNANGGNSAGLGGAGTGGTANTEPTFRVFLLLGQSNMAGYAKAEAADKVEDDRVRVLGFDDCAETGRQTDEWDTAAPPLHECWNSAVGPGDHFAKTLLPTLPEGDTIGLVPCAVSGERIETFLKVGGTRYQWILDRAKLAQDAGGVIQGILFHQGESNNGDSTWPGKVNTLVTDLRTDLGIGEVPFLAGELVGGGASHNTQVARLPGLVANAHVISAAGLVVDPADTQWNLHFDHDSTVTLGIRYAEKMIDLLAL